MTPSRDESFRSPAHEIDAVLSRQLAAAERRWRMEWLCHALGRVGLGLAVIYPLWLLLALAVPGTAREWPMGVLLTVFVIIVVFAEGHLRETDWPRIRRRVDQQLGLSDAVLTAEEMREADDSQAANPAQAAWIARQREETAMRLRRIDWRKTWPVGMTWRLWLPLVIAGLSMILLGWQFAALRAAETPPPPTAAEHETARALREMLNDWDQSQRDQPDEELKKLLADLKPLREKLADRDAALNEREAFKELSRVEEKLAAMQAKLDAQSLQPQAAEMAAALEKLEGLGALSAAVRRNDFENAETHADRAAREMQKPGAKVPQGASATDAASRLGKLAQQFGQKGNGNAQQAMSQMQAGLQRNEPSTMGQGLQGLKTSLASQNARDGQKRNLSLQCKQVGLCKGGLCNNESLGRCLSLVPKLSLQRSQKPGHGADRSTDPNRAGAPTELAADRNHENLAGTANENGESETTSLPSLDPAAERTGPGRAANFHSYDQLSQQAIADENLPLAHRQTIKRYFEAIRPAAEK